MTLSHSIGLTCWEQGCGQAFLGDSLRSPRPCDLLACQLASRREDHVQGVYNNERLRNPLKDLYDRFRSMNRVGLARSSNRLIEVRLRPWWLESTKTVSEKPGAVHSVPSVLSKLWVCQESSG